MQRRIDAKDGKIGIDAEEKIYWKPTMPFSQCGKKGHYTRAIKQKNQQQESEKNYRTRKIGTEWIDSRTTVNKQSKSNRNILQQRPKLKE